MHLKGTGLPSNAFFRPISELYSSVYDMLGGEGLLHVENVMKFWSPISNKGIKVEILQQRNVAAVVYYATVITIDEVPGEQREESVGWCLLSESGCMV